MSDDFHELVRQASRGEENAWTVLFSRYAPPLLGFLRGAGAPEPEDQLSEVFLQAARDIHRFSGDEAHFRSWLFTIARNRMLDALRSNQRRPVTVTDITTLTRAHDASQSTGRAASEEIGGELEFTRLLDLLNPLERDIIALRFVADLDTATVGKVVGKKPNTVAAITRRALIKLRRALPEGDTEK